MLQTIKDKINSIYEAIMDSNTMVRWFLICGALFLILQYGGFSKEEIRVTYLLFWYSTIATVIASFTNFVYGKVNYHKAKTDSTFIQAQSNIFYAVYLLTGLVILGTYIAQFN